MESHWRDCQFWDSSIPGWASSYAASWQVSPSPSSPVCALALSLSFLSFVSIFLSLSLSFSLFFLSSCLTSSASSFLFSLSLSPRLCLYSSLKCQFGSKQNRVFYHRQRQPTIPSTQSAHPRPQPPSPKVVAGICIVCAILAGMGQAPWKSIRSRFSLRASGA